MLAAALLAVAATVLATAFETRPAGAALPGENGKIVYEDYTPTPYDYEIFVMNHDGTGKTNLTNDGGGNAEDRMPAVSPDGTKIAFASNRNGTSEIFVMGIDGSNPTRITNEPLMTEYYPSWSPDGEKLVFVANITNENDNDIYVVNPDGSGAAPLVEEPASDSTPVFSPDGSKIAFMRLIDGDNEVFVMDSDGSDQTNLTNNTVYDGSPSWSPDGSKIAYMSGPNGGGNDIFVMGSDGSDQTNLTSDDQTDDFDPVFSPDGRRIAFSSNIDGDPDVYTMDAADGSNIARLTDGGTLSLDPDWQPNTAPTVTGMLPAPRPKVRDLTPRISATVTDVQDEFVESDVGLLVDGRHKAFSYSQATDELVYNSKKLRPGKHTAKITATDSSGADTTQEWSFTVVGRRR